MFKKTVSLIISIVLAMSVLASAFSIRPVMASGLIYINSDGSITPSTAPISTVDGVTYALTGDVDDSIIVQRANIILDGTGYVIQGPGSGLGDGVFLSYVNNVTVRNAEIIGFDCGIYLMSNYSTVLNSNLTKNNVGIGLEISYNTLSGNSITGNGVGISSNSSFSNTILGNDITENGVGVVLAYCSDNVFYHNNLINNTQQVQSYGSSPNLWDDGYPSGGNHWSDYGGADQYRGQYQNVTGIDGLGDTDYLVVAEGEQVDNYPLMGVFGPLTGEAENVSVYPADRVWLIFAEIMLKGLVTVKAPESEPKPPPGFTLEQCYIMDTSAVYSGNVTIRIIYDDSVMPGSRRLMRVVPVQGDVNDDFKVDILDIVYMVNAFGSKTGDLKYKLKCDLNGDGAVDIFDLVKAAGHFGQIWNSDTGWIDITSYVDATSKLVIGETEHLSIFGITRAL